MSELVFRGSVSCSRVAGAIGVLSLLATGVIHGETALDIQYASLDGVDSKLLSLDVYWERNGDNRPLLIYVHGGGWRGGDKKAVGVKPEWALRHGYVFASVNYRLTPEAKFPAHAQDVAAAIAWLYRNAGKYGGDPRRIYLVGHSAGSHVVALVATDERYLKANHLEPSYLSGVVALDTLMYDIAFVAAKSGGRLGGEYQATFGDDPAFWRFASPASYVSPGKAIPPLAIPYSSGADGKSVAIRKETADRFASRLKSAGIPVLVIPAPHKTHGQINQEFGREDDFVTRQAFEFFAKHPSPTPK